MLMATTASTVGSTPMAPATWTITHNSMIDHTISTINATATTPAYRRCLRAVRATKPPPVPASLSIAGADTIDAGTGAVGAP